MANDQRSTTRSAALLSASGFTLTEVVVAILLTGIIVTGTFSAILITKKTPEVSTNRVLAAMSQRQLLETLQNYQTASYCSSSVAVNALCPSNDPTWIMGPNGNWALPGDTCQACSGPTCGCNQPQCASGPGCYALETNCSHDVTDLLPSFMSGPPYFAKMCYTVVNTDNSGVQDNFRPEVSVQLLWNESQE